MFEFLRHMLRGIALPLEVTLSPLYRYPYSQAGEALRGDGLRIGKDIEAVIERKDDDDA